MKYHFLHSALFFIAFLQFHPSVSAIQCQNSDTALVVKAESLKPVESTSIIECKLDAEKAIHLSGNLTSSLVRSRGYVKVRFIDKYEKRIWVPHFGPWLGAFSNTITLSESIPVPKTAVRIQILAQVESTRNDAEGEWRLSDVDVSPGVVIVPNETTEQNTVITTTQNLNLHFLTNPDNAQGDFYIELKSLSGQVVKSQTIKKTSKLTEINLKKLGIGYYKINVLFRANADQISTWESVRVVLPDDDPPHERRFGIDGSLYMMGVPPAHIVRSLKMMRNAGIGSLRERFRWSQVHLTPSNIDWNQYAKVAETIADSGMDIVHMFHDSPQWTRPSGSPLTDRQFPFDESVLFRFGQIYAESIGKTVRSVEFWNEPNYITFFAGYPFQYASGLKAFTAGIKSIDPNIRVLIGGAANSPGRFFEEIYRNGVSNFFDTRNQHYYGNADDLDKFFLIHLAKLERDAGISDRPGWMTEMGYALRPDKNYKWDTSEIEQAEHLVKTYTAGFASGYERVFYFIWREFIEAELLTWGIVRREDISPRPAYLALALLTRHLRGASIIAAERHGVGRTIYFVKNDKSIVAVTWGGGSSISRLGDAVEVNNIFGQKLDHFSPEANGKSPLFLSHIDKIPALARPVILPNQPLHPPSTLRMEARLLIDGKEQTFLGNNQKLTGENLGHPGNRDAVSIKEGEIIELSAHIYSSDRLHGETKINCFSGQGLTLLSLSQNTFKETELNGQSFSCRYRAQIAAVGESRAAIRATNNNNSDIIDVLFTPDVASAGSRLAAYPLKPGNVCPRWIPRHSNNLTVSIESSRTVTPCTSVNIVNRINSQGNTWVFPAIQIPSNELAQSVGLRFRVSRIPQISFPPKPLSLQVIERTGSIWLVSLRQSENNGIYSGLFSLAVLAPWSPADNNGKLDLNNVREILLGWGDGYKGKIGEQYGFTVEAVDVLSESN
jgi:hypothetical protein